MKYLQVITIAFAFIPAVAFAGEAKKPTPEPAAAVQSAPAAQRSAEFRLVAELRAKDTTKVDVVTAGEKQESSYKRCAHAADVALCRILVSAVNVAAIVGTNIPVK